MSNCYFQMGACDAPQRRRRDMRPMGGVKRGANRNTKHNQTPEV